LPNESSIEGKLLYLECEGDPWEINSYKKYGIKDVTLYTQANNEITFSQNEVSFDPEEKYSEIISTGQSSEMYHDYTGSYLYIKNIHNEIRLENNILGNYSYFTLPVLPDLDYSIKIEDAAIGQEGQHSSKWIYIQPGENATIMHEQWPAIISPVNNAADITDTTTFMISDNLGPGIYQYSFRQDSTHQSIYFDIYTEKKSFKLKDIISKGIIIPPNIRFRWWVNKVPNFNSMDEFVSTPFVLDDKYTSLQNSKMFKFTTAP
jgi:hypothetical protein